MPPVCQGNCPKVGYKPLISRASRTQSVYVEMKYCKICSGWIPVDSVVKGGKCPCCKVHVRMGGRASNTIEKRRRVYIE